MLAYQGKKGGLAAAAAAAKEFARKSPEGPLGAPVAPALLERNDKAIDIAVGLAEQVFPDRKDDDPMSVVVNWGDAGFHLSIT